MKEYTELPHNLDCIVKTWLLSAELFSENVLFPSRYSEYVGLALPRISLFTFLYFEQGERKVWPQVLSHAHLSLCACYYIILVLHRERQAEVRCIHAHYFQNTAICMKIAQSQNKLLFPGGALDSFSLFLAQ